ncbi:MAG: hypothetical protein HZB56_07585 [Deltaproteobacteria bacterium]|nr:hypothetical protein [Deltaproteobacteria bacterium]
MRSAALVSAVALLLGSAIAVAHEGGADFRGVVMSAEGGQLTVRGVQGKEHRAALTHATRIFVAGQAARAADLKPGLRVVVHARKVGGQVEAVTVQAAAPAPARRESGK